MFKSCNKLSKKKWLFVLLIKAHYLRVVLDNDYFSVPHYDYGLLKDLSQL